MKLGRNPPAEEGGEETVSLANLELVLARRLSFFQTTVAIESKALQRGTPNRALSFFSSQLSSSATPTRDPLLAGFNSSPTSSRLTALQPPKARLDTRTS